MQTLTKEIALSALNLQISRADLKHRISHTNFTYCAGLTLLFNLVTAVLK